MEFTTLGRTGFRVSVVGMGCGGASRLGQTYGNSEEQSVAVVRRAMELGINYIDTAEAYKTEEIVGKAIAGVPRDQIFLSTKKNPYKDGVPVSADELIAGCEASLRRLGREQVDLIQFHNKLGAVSNPGQDTWSVANLLEMVETFAILQQEGKVRFWGFNGLGEGAAIRAAIQTDTQYTMQSCYNLLNPSAGRAMGDDFLYDNYSQAINEAEAHGVGVIAIRVLAGGALAGTLDRHPVAAATPNPLGSAPDYASDVIHAQRFAFLVHEGYAANLAEAAIRFVISKPAVSTALVGISTAEQLEAAVVAAERGALPAAVLERIAAI